MSAVLPYCFLHDNNPCNCHTAFHQSQSAPAYHLPEGTVSGGEYESTGSQQRSSPKGTSSGGTRTDTSATTPSGVIATGTAFSPLRLCFKHTNDAESGDQPHDIDLPSTVQNGAQNRMQLLQRFYDLHLGSSMHARAIFQYEAIGSGNIGRATTTSAMDTLCVAQLATTFGDARLMVESRRMYSHTMRLLGAKIRAIGDSTPGPDQLDDLIGAIHALQAGSWFQCVGVGALDWSQHVQALLRVLKVFGWSAISASTAQAFRYNWKYRAFWDGISRRVGVEYEDPGTEQVSRDLSAALLELGFRTCGMLQHSDSFLAAARHKKPKEVQVTAIRTEIGALIALLKKWHLAWTKTSAPRQRHRIVSAKYFSNFRSVSRDYFGVFPTASEFSHPAHERDFRILNICLLNLDEAIMDIHAAFPDYCAGSEMVLQFRTAEYDAATCAAELCMVVPWSSQPSNGTFACIHAMQPLQYASRYYRKHGRMLQLEWCQRVTETLTGKYGIRVKLWEDSEAFATLSC